MWTFKTELCIFTLVGLLGLASHFSNPIAITITAVVDAMDGFVPCLSDLIERPGLWFLTLIYCRKHKETKELSDGTDDSGVGFLKLQQFSAFNP